MALFAAVVDHINIAVNIVNLVIENYCANHSRILSNNCFFQKGTSTSFDQHHVAFQLREICGRRIGTRFYRTLKTIIRESLLSKLGSATHKKNPQNITKTHEYFVIFCGFWLIFEPTNFFRVISIFVGFCGLFCEILWVFVGHKIFLWVFVGFVYEKSQQKYENFLHFS